jgi:hypothetical protein
MGVPLTSSSAISRVRSSRRSVCSESRHDAHARHHGLLDGLVAVERDDLRGREEMVLEHLLDDRARARAGFAHQEGLMAQFLHVDASGRGERVIGRGDDHFTRRPIRPTMR